MLETGAGLIGRSVGRFDHHPAPKPFCSRKTTCPVGAAFSAGLVHARQNGLLTSSAIDDQQVPISRSSRSLRAASSRRERARARQIRTVERIFRTRTTDELINGLD